MYIYIYIPKYIFYPHYILIISPCLQLSSSIQDALAPIPPGRRRALLRPNFWQVKTRGQNQPERDPKSTNPILNHCF